MNSNRSFELLVVLVVFLAVVGSVNAVTLSESDTPASAEVGSSIEATYTFTELYQDPSWEEWTLRGETNLTEVTWTVTTFNQADSQIDQNSTDGASFEHPVSIDDDVAEVRVEISATVPEVEEDAWSYDPPQQFVVASFEQVREGGTSNDVGGDATLRPYTEESNQARGAIDDARAAIEDAGGHDDAEAKLQQAIGAYEDRSFGLASDLAEEAEQTTRSSQERSQTLRLALYGLVALLLLGGGAGGLYWYRSNRTGTKL